MLGGLRLKSGTAGERVIQNLHIEMDCSAVCCGTVPKVFDEPIRVTQRDKAAHYAKKTLTEPVSLARCKGPDATFRSFTRTINRPYRLCQWRRSFVSRLTNNFTSSQILLRCTQWLGNVSHTAWPHAILPLSLYVHRLAGRFLAYTAFPQMFRWSDFVKGRKCKVKIKSRQIKTHGK